MTSTPLSPTTPRARRLALGLVALGLAATALFVPRPIGAAAPDGTILEVARVEGSDAVSIRVERTVTASVAEVRAMLTDFGRYARRVPTIESATLVEHDAQNDVSVVRFRYQIVRAGSFEITRRFRGHGTTRVDFDTVSGDLGRLAGRWTLAPDATDVERTVVQYEAQLEPAFRAPSFLLRYVLKSELPSLLEDVLVREPTA